MRLLLDTHAFFWAVEGDDRLSASVQTAIGDADNEVYVSATIVWEMAIKVGLGKWPEAAGLVDGFERELAVAEYRRLPIAVPHVRRAGLMISPHRDLFDRLLAAQAQIEGLTLVTADPRFRRS